MGAEPLMVLDGPDGKLMHASLRINGAEVFLCDECVEMGAVAPTPGASSVTLHLRVDDCDAVYARALAAGCDGRMPPQDMFWGDATVSSSIRSGTAGRWRRRCAS